MARFDIHNKREWYELAWQSRFSAKALSQTLQISSRQLCRYTQQIFGLSPQAWLKQERLIFAGPMLRKTRSVKSVAFELGFKQLSHFSREFKIHYGVSPRRFLDFSDEQSRMFQLWNAQQILSIGNQMSVTDNRCPREISSYGWPTAPAR